MKKSRHVLVAGLAVLATAAIGAAPAAAQTPQPPCTAPALNVPAIQDCIIADALWVEQQSHPENVIKLAEQTFDLVFGEFDKAVNFGFDTLQWIQDEGMATVCGVLGIPEDDCPEV